MTANHPSLIISAPEGYGCFREVSDGTPMTDLGAKLTSQFKSHCATVGVGRGGSSPTLAFVEAEATRGFSER